MMKQIPMLTPMFKIMMIGTIEKIWMPLAGVMKSELAKRVKWDTMDIGKLLKVLRQTKSKKTNN
jgi:hypothetical protein